MTEDTNDRLDRLESLVDRQAATLEEQEEIIRELRQTNERLRDRLDGESGNGPTVSRRDALKAGGVLALLFGGVGTASADPQGQVGTEGQPLTALYADTLDGPIAGTGQIESLVGGGLTVTDGTLAVALDLSELSVTSFDIPDTDADRSYTVDVTVAETADLRTSDLNVTLVVRDADGNEAYNETITPSSELQNSSTTVTFGSDDGTPQLGFSTGDYTATVTVDAANAIAKTATGSFDVIDRFAGGSGTSDDPYQVANWIHLDNVRDELDKEFVQVADIDEATAGYDLIASASANGGKGFDPIGFTGDPLSPFSGRFDGNRYAITGLTIDRDGRYGTGLFGYSTGTLANITLEQVSITGSANNVGGLVGELGGSVTNSSVTGSISVDSRIGGLVGRMEADSGATVTKSYAAVDINGRNTLGGLVGQCGASGPSEGTGTISNSYAVGDVNGTGSVIGGLVGGMYNLGSTVNLSYATGSTSGSSNVGGLIGSNGQGTVTVSYWDTESTGQDTSAGSARGLTTSEMQGGEAEINMEFSFASVWETVDAENDTGVSTDDYPVLQALDRAAQLEARS